jgi:hypothetical protein
VRRGEAELARDALERLAESTQPSGTDFGLGIEARSRALLSDGAAADGLYREAIDRLGRTQLRPELARAQLLYGEWLRRENRRVDAREQLRIAHDLFAAIGMEAFAERARIELLATGQTARKRTVETSDVLTAQEAVIARLARDGLSNPEIGTRLFISARARSSTTWARCSPNWTSARAPSWTGSCPVTRPPPGRSSLLVAWGAGGCFWPAGLATGGCEPRRARTKLGGLPAPCRHRSSAAGPDDRRAVRRLVPAPMRGNGNV